jgi:hypothetical protein
MIWMVSIMFLNKSKEIIEKKIPEIKAIFTTSPDSLAWKEEKVCSSLCPGAQGDFRFLVRSLFLGEYALEKFYSVNYLIPRRHPKHECSN